MIAAPVQKTTLTPRGFSAAHDESASGTWDEFVTSREYLRLHAEHDLPDGQRDDQRVQPHDPDEDAVDEADGRAEADARENPERKAVVRPQARRRRSGSRRKR